MKDEAGRESDREEQVGDFTVVAWGRRVRIYKGTTLCWDGIRADPFLAAIVGLRLGLPRNVFGGAAVDPTVPVDDGGLYRPPR